MRRHPLSGRALTWISSMMCWDQFLRLVNSEVVLLALTAFGPLWSRTRIGAGSSGRAYGPGTRPPAVDELCPAALEPAAPGPE